MSCVLFLFFKLLLQGSLPEYPAASTFQLSSSLSHPLGCHSIIYFCCSLHVQSHWHHAAPGLPDSMLLLISLIRGSSKITFTHFLVFFYLSIFLVCHFSLLCRLLKVYFLDSCHEDLTLQPFMWVLWLKQAKK